LYPYPRGEKKNFNTEKRPDAWLEETGIRRCPALKKERRASQPGLMERRRKGREPKGEKLTIRPQRRHLYHRGQNL